ncbi:MAG: O-antigen ligase family protein [Phenylobacterium sp.]|nr:MAG: O-antigen ligase family protein [Phenylobacterium sp.]
MDERRAAPARGPGAQPPPLRWRQDDAWLALAAPALIFLGHLLYGAMPPQTALSMTVLAAILLGIALSRRGLRKELTRLDGLALPAGLFAAVILVALWSLSPFVPGGAHPVWTYLKISPGAASIDRSATLLETIKLVGLACVFVLGLLTGGSDARARLAVNTLLVLAAGLGAWAFLTFTTGTQPGGGDRMEASFLSANTAGTVFAASLVLAAGPAVSRLGGAPGRRLGGGVLFGVAALLFLVCIFATASRGAFLAAFAGLLTMGLLMVFGRQLKWSRAVMTGGAAAAVVAVLLLVAGDFLLNRLMGGTHEFASRAFILHVHWQAFLDSPLFGYGLGTFDTVNRLLLNAASFPKIWTVRAAHNIYLDWLEQGGLFAALPMFACLGALMITTARKAFRRSRMIPILFALLGLDVVFLVHGATDFALEMFSVAAMWAYLLGLQFSLAQGSSAR